MIRFNNDYNCSAHEKVLEAMKNTTAESYGGYGIDPWCEKAENEIKKYLDCDKAKVHFLVGGTQTNYVVLDMIYNSTYIMGSLIGSSFSAYDWHNGSVISIILLLIILGITVISNRYTDSDKETERVR